MEKLKLDIQRFAPDPPVTGNLIDESCMYEYDTKIKQHISDKTGTLSNLTTTAQSNLVAAINELKSEIDKRDNFIVTCISADQTFTTANAVTVVNLNASNQSNGDLLTFNSTNHTITVGAGVNHVEVSGCVYVSTVGTSGAKNAYVYRERSGNAISVARSVINMTNNANTITLSPKIVPTEEGDIFTLRFMSANGTTTKIGSDSGAAYNRFVIRVID